MLEPEVRCHVKGAFLIFLLLSQNAVDCARIAEQRVAHDHDGSNQVRGTSTEEQISENTFEQGVDSASAWWENVMAEEAAADSNELEEEHRESADVDALLAETVREEANTVKEDVSTPADGEVVERRPHTDSPQPRSIVSRIFQQTQISAQLALHSASEVGQRLVKRVSSGSVDADSKIARVLRSAENSEALAHRYIRQVSQLEMLKSGNAHKVCVSGDTCSLEVAQAGTLRYTLEAGLPCLGDGDTLEFQVLQSSWSSPHEGRSCPEGAKLHSQLPPSPTLALCQAACHVNAECTAVAFDPHAQACDLCSHASSSTLPRARAEVHRIERHVEVQVPAQQAGRQLVCAVEDDDVQVAGWVDVRAVRAGQHAACFEGVDCEVRISAFQPSQGGILVLTRIANAVANTEGNGRHVAQSDDGCVGNGTRVVHRASLQITGSGTLMARVNQSVLAQAAVFRMCYCPGGECGPTTSQGVGFLRILPGCSEDFESFASSLSEAHSDCIEFAGAEVVSSGNCDELRAQPQCLLSVDALLFHPARRFDVERQQLLGQPVRNCWAWAKNNQQDAAVQAWKNTHSEVWAFAETWGSECGQHMSRTSVCGAFSEGNTARQFRESWGADRDALSSSWVGNQIHRMETGLWSFQRGAGNALNFARNLAEPQTYSGEGGRLSCPPGMFISQISFASYGNPKMKCGEMAIGSCDAGVRVVEDVEASCLWRNECQVRPFTANGTTRWPLESSACSEEQHMTPRLALEATCVQTSENSIEQLVQASDSLHELVEDLAENISPAVSESLSQLGGEHRPYQGIVDDICRDCGTVLANIENLPESVCPAEGRLRLHTESMCTAAESIAEAEFVADYMGDVQTVLGSSVFGRGAVRNEVCKDLHLCGYNSNLAVATITAAPGMAPSGVSASQDTLRALRSQLLQAYQGAVTEADQANMCSTCESFHVPELLELEVWDADSSSRDDFLGGVYIDMEAAASSSTGSTMPLRRHAGRGSGYNQSGSLTFSWSVSLSELTVTIHSATSLAGRDLGTRPDPYVVVSYGPASGCSSGEKDCHEQTNELGQTRLSKSTERISNDESPVWETQLVFRRAPTRELVGREAEILGAALSTGTGSARAAFVALSHAFGRRKACMHVGLCEYSSNTQRRLGFIFGGSGAAILKEVSMRGHIDRRYDEIMTQLNNYPCRSGFTPKNLLLTFTTWRNLQYITKTLFRMRQAVDESYLLYVRGRNQQVMRGLFHSDVMKNVPSYLRGILESAVSGMLEGRPVSKTELFTSLAVAFKRFAMGAVGRALASPILITTALVNLVLTGGRVVLRDFLYNFVFRGLREGKSISDLLRDAGAWIRRSGRRSYTAARDVVLGTDNCPNTVNGPPTFVTGDDARQLFTVGAESGANSLLEVAQQHSGTSLSELHTKRYTASSTHVCNGVTLSGQQYGLLDAADGLSLSELRRENTYSYDHYCTESVTETYLCGTDWNYEPPQDLYCSETTNFEYECVLTGYFWGGYDDNDGSNLFFYQAENGKSFSQGADWHSQTIYDLANANPDATACELHELLLEEGDAEAQRLQEQQEQALLVLMYVAMTIYVLTYLACVHSTIPSAEKMASGEYGVGSIARSALGCTLWPFTWGSLLRQTYPERYHVQPRARRQPVRRQPVRNSYDNGAYDNVAYDNGAYGNGAYGNGGYGNGAYGNGGGVRRRYRTYHHAGPTVHVRTRFHNGRGRHHLL